MRQLTLILLLSLAGCTVGTSPPPAAQRAPAAPATAVQHGEDAASLLVRIRNGIGPATCSDSAQCKTIALGARACGGPEAYLPYSTAVNTSEPLVELAARHAERRRASVAATGTISTCEIVTDPGAVCVKGTCQLRKGLDDPT